MSSDGMTPDASTSTDALKPGDLFDRRYRILKKLGEGGMGEVYAAKHEHIEKRVAIKVLRPEIVTNKEAVARFAQEARSASGIGHKNIIGIDDFGYLADGRIYLSMEFLDGAALNDLIKQPGGLSHDRLLNILIQTGHGLSAAHSRGIVHRDMKPENIFVTTAADGSDLPKLLDFGIAKVAGNDGQNNLTKTGTIFGTPFYMAPEQAMGQQIDGRVDIYAMGVIIYEVFAGSLPFRGESFMGILTQHITTDPEPVAVRAAAAGRQVPPGIPEIVTRAMAKDPERRFQTMDELVAALVAVYRMVAGSGMSQYMEAHQGPRSAMMPAPAHMPTSGGMAVPPTGPYPGMPTPGGMMPPPPGHAQQTPLGQMSSGSGGYAADGSMMMPARKSKAGVIAAIIIALVVIGGGVTLFLVSQGKKSDDTAAGSGEASGTEVASGSGEASGTDLGTGTGTASGTDVGTGAGTASGTGSGTDLGTGSGTGTGSQVAAATPDAGVAEVPIDAAVAVNLPPDASVPVKVELIAVLLDANADGAKIYENGKQIGKVPELIKVVPGEKRIFVLKKSGYKDKTVVVDGSSNELKVVMEKTGGKGSGTGTGTGTGTSKPPEDPRKAFCKKHPDDMRCQIEP